VWTNFAEDRSTRSRDSFFKTRGSDGPNEVLPGKTRKPEAGIRFFMQLTEKKRSPASMLAVLLGKTPNGPQKGAF
jgi:hypothetical protein